MKILVSACLLGENCKYSGGNNRNEAVLHYLQGHEVIPVCPEVMGGLPVPRKSAEIVSGIVRNSDGISVDEAFRNGAARALWRGAVEGIDLAILQPRSPSCGAHQVYDGSFSKKLIPGKGVFAQMLDACGIPILEPDDLDKE